MSVPESIGPDPGGARESDRSMGPLILGKDFTFTFTGTADSASATVLQFFNPIVVDTVTTAGVEISTTGAEISTADDELYYRPLHDEEGKMVGVALSYPSALALGRMGLHECMGGKGGDVVDRFVGEEIVLACLAVQGNFRSLS